MFYFHFQWPRSSIRILRAFWLVFFGPTLKHHLTPSTSSDLRGFLGLKVPPPRQPRGGGQSFPPWSCLFCLAQWLLFARRTLWIRREHDTPWFERGWQIAHKTADNSAWGFLPNCSSMFSDRKKRKTTFDRKKTKQNNNNNKKKKKHVRYDFYCHLRRRDVKGGCLVCQTTWAFRCTFEAETGVLFSDWEGNKRRPKEKRRGWRENWSQKYEEASWGGKGWVGWYLSRVSSND